MNIELEKFLANARATNLNESSLEDLRKVRTECSSVETDVSFVRRVSQGRLDIVGHEVNQRSTDSHSKLDVSDLLFDLPEILRDETIKGGGMRRVGVDGPGPMANVLGTELDTLVSPNELSSIDSQDENRLLEVFNALQDFESDLSIARRTLHEVIDNIQQEIGRRYKHGEASIANLLSPKS